MTIEGMTPDVYYGAAGQQALHERVLQAAQQEQEEDTLDG